MSYKPAKKRKQPVKKAVVRTPISKVLVSPGPNALQAFLSKNSKLFNQSELERLCKLPRGTMRQLTRNEPRNLTWNSYESVRDNLLPVLLRMVFILQNNDRRIIEVELGY